MKRFVFDGKPEIEVTEDENPVSLYKQNINVLVETSDGKISQWFPTVATIPMQQSIDNLNDVLQIITVQAQLYVDQNFNQNV